MEYVKAILVLTFMVAIGVAYLLLKGLPEIYIDEDEESE